MLWGTSPILNEPLTWHTVYQQVAATTFILGAMLALDRVASEARPRRAALVASALMTAMAALLYGGGLATAVAMPVVAGLVLDESPARGSAVRTFKWLAGALVVVFVTLPLVNRALYGSANSPPFILVALTGLLHLPAVFLHLIGYGLSGVALGVLQRPSGYPEPAVALAVLLAVAILVPANRGRRPVRVRLRAWLGLAAALYGSIALGRAAYVSWGLEPANLAKAARLHYLGTRLLTVALFLALARIGRVRRLERASGPLLLAWAGVSLLGYLAVGQPVELREGTRRETRAILAHVRQAAQTAGPNETVYMENRTFRSVGVGILTSGFQGSFRAGRRVRHLPSRRNRLWPAHPLHRGRPRDGRTGASGPDDAVAPGVTRRGPAHGRVPVRPAPHLRAAGR